MKGPPGIDHPSDGIGLLHPKTTPRGLPMVNLHSVHRRIIDGTNSCASTSNIQDVANTCTTSTKLSGADYSIASRMANQQAEQVLACLLDTTNANQPIGNRRALSENPVESNLYRERYEYYKEQKMVKTCVVGIKVQVVVPVETLKNRFGERPTDGVNNATLNLNRIRSESLTTVREAQGIAYARSISEKQSANHQLAPPAQNINDRIRLAQGKVYPLVNSCETSRERW